MINRILIRIKVLQIVYSYYQNGNGDLKVAENELLFSLQKSYDLYHYYLLLITEVTNLQRRLIDIRRNKFMPSHDELNPNTRLINNRFAAQVADNAALRKYVDEQGLSWANDEEFIKSLLDLILASDIYENYLANEEDSYETDREFWRQVFKKLICGNEMVEEYLEDKSIYWNDDIDIIGTNLFRKTILKGPELRERINKHVKNWEAERLACMDMIIMQTALAEILTFPTIPTSVSLNEYIDAAKYYSTPKSGNFINGILDAIVNELKKEGTLLKD